jgi:hypothetical protein
MRDPMWRLETRYSEPLTKINQELKDDKWSYKVVFQKALLRSYLELLEQAEEFIGDEYPTIELRTRFTDYWIEAINVRGGPGCLNRFSASISGASARVRLPSGVAAG